MKPRTLKRLGFAVGGLAVVAALAGLGTLVGIFWWYGRGVAELDEARLKNYRPPQITRVRSRDGAVIGEIFTQRRIVVHYQDIPSHVENAFLAAEDADFYRHEGMDYMGMARALIANIRAGRVKQGASTITQQVVKTFMLSPDQTFERKVQEIILARRLERAFSKREILELYLNEIYLGHGRYGIEAASQFYFGKGIQAIDLGQAALLATLPKAPGRDSPLLDPERSRTRRVYVLRQMVEHGFCSAADAEAFIQSDDLGLAAAAERPGVVPGAEEFVDAVRAELEHRYGPEVLAALGADVVTTVALPLQQTARAAVIGGLVELDQRNGYAHRLKPAKPEAQAKARAAVGGALAVGREADAVVQARAGLASLPDDGFMAALGTHEVVVRVPEGSRYDDPKLAIDEQFPVGAIVPVVVTRLAAADARANEPGELAQAEIAAGPEAAIIVIDAPTGEVLAMVGGSRYGIGEFNRVLQARRQPGSAFKPFVYGAALLSEAYTAATMVSDSPEIYEKWKPTNFEADVYLGDVRLRTALQKSINTIAIKLIDRVGVAAVIDFATRAGIESALPSNLSLALGTGEVTPLELARGYLTLARGGERIEPTFILEVRTTGAGVDDAPKRVAARVLPEDVVFVLTSMMESVVQGGTGAKARALGRPVAGKTGTSANFADAWFAGFTPTKVAVTWVGFDRPKRLGRSETGGRAAIPIWLRTMESAVGDEVAVFVPPPSVTVRRIDAASGLLVPSGAAAEGYAAESLAEFFVPGTEPVEEAVPAALPAGDVLLDLYGDEATPTSANPDGDAAPVARTGAPRDPTPASDRLPSLADVP